MSLFAKPAPEIDAPALKQLLAGANPPVVLDVRNADEREFCRIEGSMWMPLPEIEGRMGELPRDRPIVTQCHHGMRSAKAQQILMKGGFADVTNLAGGIHGWSEQVDPGVPLY